MTLISKSMNRNRAVSRRFGAQADSYDAHADLQQTVSAELASLLPLLKKPGVLEIGCGTGFLTRHLVAAYPDADLLVTDLAPEMVERCRAGMASPDAAILRFAVMDGETPDCKGGFDLVASSMTLQWFADPRAGLARLKRLLKPGGTLLYATLGPESFAEWRSALAGESLPEGIVAMTELPGVVQERHETVNYETAADFLRAMRAIGATEPRTGYRPLPPGKLRRALKRLESDHGARVSWHIVYGRIEA